MNKPSRGVASGIVQRPTA